MSAPHAELRERVAKLLGMCGSSHDGEALNAARLADRLIRRCGTTWHEIIQPPPIVHRPPPSPRDRSGAFVWQHYRNCLLDQPELLISAWEREFVTSLCRKLSPRQGEVFARICRRAFGVAL